MSANVYADFRCRVVVEGRRFRAIVTGSRSGATGEADGVWPAPTLLVWIALMRAFWQAVRAPVRIPESERREAVWRQTLTPEHRTKAFFHEGYRVEPGECCDSCRAHMAFGVLTTTEVEARHA